MQKKVNRSELDKILKNIEDANKFIIEANKINMETQKLLIENSLAMKKLLKDLQQPASGPSVVSNKVISSLNHFLTIHTQ